MTPNDVTEKMLEILNQGVAGIAIPDLQNIANGLLMAKGRIPGALAIGNMLLAMIALNQDYKIQGPADSLVLPEWTNPRGENNGH